MKKVVYVFVLSLHVLFRYHSVPCDEAFHSPVFAIRLKVYVGEFPIVEEEKDDEYASEH